MTRRIVVKDVILGAAKDLLNKDQHTAVLYLHEVKVDRRDVFSGHLEFRVRVPHRQHRAGGLLDDLLSRVAEEHLLEPCPAVGADHDEIYLLAACKLDDFIKGDSVQDVSVAVYIIGNLCPHHFFKFVGRVLLELEIELGQDGRAQGVFGKLGEILQDMREIEPRVEKIIQIDRVAECMPGR